MKKIIEQQTNSPVKAITVLDRSNIIVQAKSKDDYQRLMGLVGTYKRLAPIMWKLENKLNFTIKIADPKQGCLAIEGNVSGFVEILCLNNLISETTGNMVQADIANSLALSASCTLL